MVKYSLKVWAKVVRDLEIEMRISNFKVSFTCSSSLGICLVIHRFPWIGRTMFFS